MEERTLYVVGETASGQTVCVTFDDMDAPDTITLIGSDDPLIDSDKRVTQEFDPDDQQIAMRVAFNAIYTSGPDNPVKGSQHFPVFAESTRMAAE